MIVKAFLLIFSLSIDTILAGLSIGMNRIHFPISNIIVLNLFGVVILGIAMTIGNGIAPFFSISFLKLGSTILFIGMAIVKFLESFQKWVHKKREIRFRISHLEFIFHIYSHPEKADLDFSKQLSWKEACILGLALSLDNFALGIGYGFTHSTILIVLLMSFGIGMSLLVSGMIIGNHLSKKINFNISWMSGILFLILAFFH